MQEMVCAGNDLWPKLRMVVDETLGNVTVHSFELKIELLYRDLFVIFILDHFEKTGDLIIDFTRKYNGCLSKTFYVY